MAADVTRGDFIALAVVLAVALLAPRATRGRRPQTSKPPVDTQAATIAGRMAKAAETAKLPVRLRGAAKVTADGDGREWVVTLEGATTLDYARDHADELASALNEPRPVVAALEFRPTTQGHPGHAILATYRRDPLLRTVELTADMPGRPTTVTQPVLFSRGADGRTHRCRVLNDGGGIHGGLFGQNRSGKSAGLSVVLEQLCWCPDALLLGIEMSPKLGADMRQLGRRFDRIVTQRDGWPACRTLLTEVDAYLSRRAGELADLDPPQPKMSRFSAERPFVVLVVDEAHRVFQEDDQAADLLTQLAKTHAAMGLSIQAVTQFPTVDAIPSAFRSQLLSKVAWRLDNAQETNIAMGGRWGEKTPGPHTIPGADSEDEANRFAGQCYSSLDGGMKIRQRTLWASPALLANTNKATAHLRLTLEGTR